MTTQDTTPTPPPPVEGPRLALLDLADVLDALDVATSALDGDGSTAVMPDVRPDQAARWMFAALDQAGYVIVKRADK